MRKNAINCLVVLVMLYMAIILVNMIMTNRFILLFGNEFVLGGAFFSPLLFVVGDVIAELFGFKRSRFIIYVAFASQFIFVACVLAVMHAPYPATWHHEDAFDTVFGTLARINISSFLAFVFASIINAGILTRWKALVNGRFFWLRSLGSSTFSEFLYSAFAIIMIEFNNVSTEHIVSIILLTFLIKIAYSLIFAFPGNLLVYLLKKYIQADYGNENSVEEAKGGRLGGDSLISKV